MKSNVASLVLVAGLTSVVSAQWTPTGSGAYLTNTAGNVGVGIAPPASNVKFDIVADSPFSIGLFSQTSVNSGIGVFGKTTSTSSDGKGVWGESAASAGVGVYGLATSTAGGLSRGVLGICRSPNGTALLGTNESTTGPALGLRGETYSTSGYALSGYCTATTGTNYALAGHTQSASGYALYATGGRNYIQGYLGLGLNTNGTSNDNPQANLHLKGTMRVENLAASTATTRGALGVDSSNGNVSARSFAVGNGIKYFWPASPASTWVAPAGVTKVRIRAWGGGGGGTTNFGSGTSGAYIEAFVSVVAGTTYTIDVGNGGAPDTVGGNTQMLDGATVILSAGGGGIGGLYTPGTPTINTSYIDSSACVQEFGRGSSAGINNQYVHPKVFGYVAQRYNGIPISVGSGGPTVMPGGTAMSGVQGHVVIEW